jgi:hypothetical protein
VFSEQRSAMAPFLKLALTPARTICHVPNKEIVLESRSDRSRGELRRRHGRINHPHRTKTYTNQGAQCVIRCSRTSSALRSAEHLAHAAQEGSVSLGGFSELSTSEEIPPVQRLQRPRVCRENSLKEFDVSCATEMA